MRFEEADRLLDPGYLPLESGTADLGDGYKLVAALTPMPRCRAKMVHGWFGWLGHVESRDPAYSFTDGQAREIRHQGVTDELARRLHRHAVEEMGYLADLLPALYTRVTDDATF